MPALTLTPDPTSPRQARHFVNRLLNEWSVDSRTIEDASLLATELVTNAVLHARTSMSLDVRYEAGTVYIAVSDSDPGRPVVQAQDRAASTGRGLYLLDRIADQWEVSYGDAGKTISFTLTTDGDRS